MNIDLSVEKNAGEEETATSAVASDIASILPFHADGDMGEEAAADGGAADSDQCVPATARAWGFVRNLQIAPTTREQSREVKPAEKDVTLWLDEERYRFLVATDQRVIDDLSPLQFVQFVRQLRHVTSRILFKYERQPNGSARALRVWAA